MLKSIIVGKVVTLASGPLQSRSRAQSTWTLEKIHEHSFLCKTRRI